VNAHPLTLAEGLATLSALLDGKSRGRTIWTSPAEESSSLIRLLRRNKYPLLALRANGDANTTLEASSQWRAAVADDTRQCNALRDEYLAVKRAWAQAGIPCLMIKSAGTYPSFPYTSDNLDLLVPRAQCAQARAILLELGYVWLKNIDEPQKFLFRKFHGGRSVSAIHVHSWVGWDVEFHEDVIWERVRPADDDPDVLVPSREDAILINAAHALYENKRFTLYDLEKIWSQWSKDGVDWSYMEGVARRRGWLDGLYFSLLACAHLESAVRGACGVSSALLRRWEDGLSRSWLASRYWQHLRRRRPIDLPFRVSFPFSKLLYYGKILRDEHRPGQKRLSNLCKTLAWGLRQKSGIRPQPGMLVSLSGLDGVGKTTNAEALANALAVSEIACRLVWSRRGCSGLYRLVSRLGKPLLRRAESLPLGGGSVDPQGVTHGGPHVTAWRFLWACFNALDLLLVYLLRVRVPLVTGKVVICDRYAYDGAVELRQRLPPSDRLSDLPVRLLVALSPKPRAAYLLDVPAPLAVQRSGEMTAASEVHRERELYLRIAHDHSLRIRDASQDCLTVNDTLVREVLQEYLDDFDTLLNGLFLSNRAQLNSDGKPVDPGGEG
jgi:thymidylate kinase